MVTVGLAVSSMQPWLPDWNCRLMDLLFRVVRRHRIRSAIPGQKPSGQRMFFWSFVLLLLGHSDEGEVRSKTQLLVIMLSTGAAILITMAARFGIVWPAPARRSLLH
jgi:hypothetical protein